MAISCYSSGTTVRDVDPSSVGMMEGAFFVSRTELLDWVNTNFNLSLTKVEQAASGAVYLQIVDALYGGNACVVPMAKVKWNCKYDYEYIQNYKLLQAVFTKQGIKKHIEVDRLIKGKYQDNLEFLQWLKAFYDRQAPAQLQQRALHAKPYNALERRKLAGSVFPEWAQPSECCSAAAAGADVAASAGTPPPPAAHRHEGSSRNACIRGRSQGGTAGVASHAPALVRYSSSQCSPAGAAAVAAHHTAPSARVHRQQQHGSDTGYCCNSSGQSNSSGSHHHQPGEVGGHQQQQQLVHQLQEEVKQLKELVVKLETEGEQAWLEREFYFRKLRRLEIMCTTPGAVALSTKEVLTVLYATDDEAETQATAADETLSVADPQQCMHAQKVQEQDDPTRSTTSSDTRNSSNNTGVAAAAPAAGAAEAAAMAVSNTPQPCEVKQL